MDKKITFSHKGKEYTLQFTRKTRAMLEQSGLVVTDVFEKMVSVLPEFFHAAFLANDRFIDRKLTDEIFDNLTSKKAMFFKLVELWNAPLDEMLEEPEEGNGIEWEANF